MKLLLPFLVATLLAVTYGATIEPVQAAEPAEVAEQDEEYRWKRKVGEALERVGKWLQGRYTAATEEEQVELELVNAGLEDMVADMKDDLSELDDEVDEVDEDEDEEAAYGLRKKWRKWRKKAAKIAKKIGATIAINKAAAAIAGASG